MVLKYICMLIVSLGIGHFLAYLTLFELFWTQIIGGTVLGILWWIFWAACSNGLSVSLHGYGDIDPRY